MKCQKSEEDNEELVSVPENIVHRASDVLYGRAVHQNLHNGSNISLSGSIENLKGVCH